MAGSGLLVEVGLPDISNKLQLPAGLAVFRPSGRQLASGKIVQLKTVLTEYLSSGDEKKTTFLVFDVVCRKGCAM